MEEESYEQQITAEKEKQFTKLKHKKYSEDLIYMMAIEKILGAELVLQTMKKAILWEELKNEEELGLVWFGFRWRFDSGWRCVVDGEKAMHRSYGVAVPWQRFR